MKPIFGQGMHAGKGGRVLQGLLAACCLGVAVNASAEVNDAPYFQLFPDAPIDFGSPPATSGYPALGGTSVSICGNGDCSAAITVAHITTNPAGTGFRDSFLRLNEPANAKKSPDGTPLTTESGYNTNEVPLQQDATFTNDSQDSPGAGNDWNRAVLISDLKVVDGFYQILLDLNEQGTGSGDQFIKLDEFEIHLSSDGLLDQYDPDAASSNGRTGAFGDTGYTSKVFDMDWWSTVPSDPNNVTAGGLILKNCAGGVLDNKGKCGSGDEDYVFNIPVALLAGGTYLHIVATMGEVTPNGNSAWDPVAVADAGFDEFAALTGSNDPNNPDTGVPVPGTALLLGVGLLGLCRQRRRSAA